MTSLGVNKTHTISEKPSPASAADWFTKLPRPKPDMMSYETELRSALALSSQRNENYNRFLSSSRSESIDYHPVRMDIENVSRCNFRCPKCQVSAWPGGRRSKDMDFSEFERLLEVLYGVVEIKLQGMGEPLLQGTPFFKMIECARRRHIWVRTTTNASLLHIGEMYKRFIDADPNEVQISIDGADKKTFEKIRKGSDFGRITQNCKLINQYCDSQNLLKTRMWVCLQSQNLTQFKDMVRLSASLGFRRLSFAVNLHGWGLDDHLALNKRYAVDNLMSLELALEGIDLGNQLGVEVTFWNNISKYDFSGTKTLCPWPFERAFVSSDMRVVPCCMVGNPGTADFGSGHHFDQIWFGDVYHKFRRSHIEGRLPSFCRPCYVSN